MTATPLWRPCSEYINSTRMLAFCRQLDADLGLAFEDYPQLHRWSVENPGVFWEQVWRFTGIKASQPYTQVLSDGDQFPGAKWFTGAKLNFAENLLRNRSDKTALVSWLENGSRRSLSYGELYEQVARYAAALRRSGVTVGDRVAGFMPNIPETVTAMLATASIGATWSSCSPDFGSRGVIDRFGQIRPKVVFGCDHYFYNGKIVDTTSQLQAIGKYINSVESLVLVPVTGENDDPERQQNPVPEASPGLDKSIALADFIGAGGAPPLTFAQLPFDHPLYIMYSSGTTGVPKCIVHSAGGALIQHLKEHQLHLDLQPQDVLFYFTTCGWMMWNWLVSGLASEAVLVLYDGSPTYPHTDHLFAIAEREHISVFGTSPRYLAALEKAGIKPRENRSLPDLRMILSTGSPLSGENFRYVYRDIKEDLCLSSISGGTDIISCFVLGNSCQPVWEGEIQCLGLGMAVEIRNEKGQPVRGEKGELVCTRPFPSAPIYFWNDPDGSKYYNAYFADYPNEADSGVWAHGDYGEITEHDGMIIHGRSDAVLNPGGVRIGTAEIYRQVEKIPQVLESLCIGQEWRNDVRVILFVVLKPGETVTAELQQSIRDTIRRETTPRHVPAKIIAVGDIPRTLSGKIVELAVRNVVHNRPVKNTDALANPKALALFKDLPDLQ